MLLIITIFAVLLAGLSAILFMRWQYFSKYFCAVLFAISGGGAVAAGANVLVKHQQYLFDYKTGFSDFSCQFRVDSLSAFFLILIGVIVLCVAVYLPGYLRSYERKHSLTSLNFFTAFFILGMYLVVCANDIFSFMFSWELMSISSYFLVAYEHQHAANRKAAFVYLLMAHLSGLLILFGFGILAKLTGSLNFVGMHAVPVTTYWATIAFIVALLGFAMKAGAVPLHVWLPQAHPVAPSHISALMSGVMLKVAIYGFIRFVFYLLGNIDWQWGVIVLLLGAASAIFGVLYALTQNNLKKLLAYCSVENVGIIFIALGLSMIFISNGHMILGALGFIAALYHCFNHALFKSLLFLGAGTILQHSHEHDLEKMGGLIHKMPQTALFFLFGCLSVSALPPFNGFVSEWLTLQTALHVVSLKSGVLHIIIPLAAAILALTSAVAAACFVKVYGVAFLGQARTRHVRRAQDPCLGMRLAMGFLAILCLLFGLFPSYVLNVLGVISNDIIGASLARTQSWLWVAPFTSQEFSYSASLVFISVIGIMLLVYLFAKLFFNHAKVRQEIPWDCGFGGITTRMQYSATAFAMPLRRVFKNIWQVQEKIEKNSNGIAYQLVITDWLWKYLYEPLERVIAKISNRAARLQGGNIRIYLIYVFFTLIFILWVVA